MRRRTCLPLTALAATGALCAGLVGTAAASRHHGPHRDAVSGSAVNGFPTPAGPGSARLTVAASSGRLGQHPRGTVSAHGTTGAPMGAFRVSGPVTCLRVEGNEAAIKYRFRHASGSAAPFKGGGVEVFIKDNGHGRRGKPADENAFDAPQTKAAFDANAKTCDDPAAAAFSPVRSGKYTVRDRDRQQPTKP